MFLSIVCLLVGLICALVAGYCTAEKEKADTVVFLFIALIVLVVSYFSIRSDYLGNPAKPINLDEKIIYQIVGRMEVQNQQNQILALANGEGDIRYITAELLPLDVEFVKKVSTGFWTYRLEPVKRIITEEYQRPVSQ